MLNIFVVSAQVYSATNQTDTVIGHATTEVIIISSFEQYKKQGSSAINIEYLNSSIMDRGNSTSLLHGLNTVSGVRMEERSPGSYRINIRGSSLRAPFGVRNVKVYWNGIPVTDPGGNTYFNQFAVNNFSSVEIFKGPAGSLYGAGTGGLIMLNTFNPLWQQSVNAEYITGSYGLQSVMISAAFGKKDNRNFISYAHNQSHGFREHTKMRRDNFSWVSELRNTPAQKMAASFLYTDMFYQTPGALTLPEMKANPQSARPAAGNLPSAVEANASILQRNLLAGLTNQQQISARLKNTTALYGAFAIIENPAIRNYELRHEPHMGFRTSLQWQDTISDNTQYQLVAGAEAQQGFFRTRVSGNSKGNPDTLQADDEIRNSIYTYFTQADFTLYDRIYITGGISTNGVKVRFRRFNKLPVQQIERTYRNQLAPMLSVNGKITRHLTLGASISKGFSPPTLAELLPSTSVISTDLEAETGTNREISIKQSLFKNRLQLAVNAYIYSLKNALVQRRDNTGADYYINAGSTSQNGLEVNIIYSRQYAASKMLNNISLRNACAFSNFIYQSLAKDTVDFSGKFMPGVPAQTISMIADINFKNGFYLNFTGYFASSVFLNDANTAKAEAYKLIGMRAGWFSASKKMPVHFYTGVDNLLNVSYSLGNDINDPRQRFYNPAPGRNYYMALAYNFSFR